MQDEVDEVLVEVSRTIAQRTANGDYPVNLEVNLQSEFEQAVREIHRSEQGTLRLAANVAAVRAGAADIHGTATIRSRIPGGAVAHALIRRLISRHTNQLAEDVKKMGQSTAEALDEVRQALTKASQPTGAEPELVEVLARALAKYDELSGAVAALGERLDRLERGNSPQQ